MLQIEIDDQGHIQNLCASGSTELVAALFGAAINGIFTHLSEAHPEAGELFKTDLEAIMASGMVWSPRLTKTAGRGECVVCFEPDASAENSE